jgi:hypothetical protein
MADKLCHHLASSTPNEGFFNMPQTLTWNRRLYFPSKGSNAEDFFALKNPTASV